MARKSLTIPTERRSTSLRKKTKRAHGSEKGQKWKERKRYSTIFGSIFKLISFISLLKAWITSKNQLYVYQSLKLIIRQLAKICLLILASRICASMNYFLKTHFITYFSFILRQKNI